MQRIYAIVILIITTTFAQAQINEVSISTNPILQKHHAEKEHRVNSMLQQRAASLFPANAATRDVEIKNGICIQSGNSYFTCIDTSGMGEGTTVLLLNGGMQSFGTATVDTFCLNFQTDTNVDFGVDSLKLEVCPFNDDVCDTIIYPILVHRPDNTITLATTILNAEDTITICVDTGVLPTNYQSSFLIGNNNDLGEVYSFGSCIFYEANRFAGEDVVSFQVCDEYCVCDTYEIPFTITQDTISLPFMDDFSYQGPYPSTKWLDKNAFVNNNMAIDPVSVGVATMDGLDNRGAPYGGGFGSSDELTSAYLDMSSYSANSDVYLSFYVEPQGLGEAPTEVDSLILEYKNSSGDWNIIAGYRFENLPIDTFSYFSYHINENQYFYKGFQFRFRNFSLRSGSIDHWHIDYVRLASGISDSPFLTDIAFTQVPNPILETYTSMPWWHFIENMNNEIPSESTFVETHLFSHEETLNTAEDAVINLTETETNTNVLVDLGIFNGNEADIPPGQYALNFPTIAPTAYPSFVTTLDVNPNFPDDSKLLKFEKTYSFNVGEESPGVNPIVEDNNVVTHTTIFDNYFAYDDGTAESAIEATKKQVQIALKFHSNVDDTLKAVQFHFPHIKANVSAQNFTLKIWIGQLDEEAEYEGFLSKPLYIDSYLDSLNGFATYLLKNLATGERTPLFIPAGDFYVGWQQISDCSLNECIPVGTDKNNPEGMENVFFDGFGFGLDWKNVLQANPSLTGSLMIRPMVGEGMPEQSSKTDDIENKTSFTIFPNPTSGFINIDIENGTHDGFSFVIFDAVGKLIMARPLSNQLDISNLQNGIYFIKITNDKTNEIFNRKIILAK